MQTPKITTLVAVLLALAVPAMGQAVYVLRLPGTNVTEGFYLPSAEYTAGSSAATNPRVPVLNLPHFFAGAVSPTAFPGQGGHAIDQQICLVCPLWCARRQKNDPKTEPARHERGPD